MKGNLQRREISFEPSAKKGNALNLTGVENSTSIEILHSCLLFGHASSASRSGEHRPYQKKNACKLFFLFLVFLAYSMVESNWS